MTKVGILHIIARMNIGGPALHVAQLLDRLDQENFEPKLVSGHTTFTEGDMTDLADKYDLDFYLFQYFGPKLSLWKDMYTFARLWRFMLDMSPMIVHTHTAKAGALGRVAAKMANVPIIVHTFHGHVFSGYWGKGVSKIVILVERLLARLSTVILTVSDSVRNELINHNIAPAEKIQVMSLGLDLSIYMNCSIKRGQLRDELSLTKDWPIVGNIGRLVPIKNHHYFIKSAHQMLQDGFEGYFVIVGDGILEPKLRKLVDALGIEDSVLFTGWRRDLDIIYADIDVLVNTSLNEGTPFAIIEAMAARIPIVATEVGGVPDMIQHEHTGFLVPTDDTNVLSDTIRIALEVDDYIVDNAQKYVIDNHSVDGMIDNAMYLYNNLLGDHTDVV